MSSRCILNAFSKRETHLATSANEILYCVQASENLKISLILFYFEPRKTFFCCSHHASCSILTSDVTKTFLGENAHGFFQVFRGVSKEEGHRDRGFFALH